MLGRSGSWINAGAAGAIASGRWWFYQDFVAGSGPGIVLTTNENGSGGSLSWSSTNVVTNSAVVTDTDGNPVFSTTTETPVNEVSVSSNSGSAVTLNAAVDASFGTVRIWYLYTASTGSLPNNMEVAPDFVKAKRIQWLDSHFLNQNLNLSDVTNAATARSNLGFVTNAAGQVLYGDGTSIPQSDANNFWDSANKRLGLFTASPVSRLHANDTGANALEARFTNSVSGATSSDGFIVGIDASANAVINQKENLPMIFSTNNTEVGRFNAAGTMLLKKGIDLEDPGAGTNIARIQAPTLAVDWTLTLPTTGGTTGYLLRNTDGAGTSTWSSLDTVLGLTTKGDILAYSTTSTRFPIGTSYGMHLQVDSSATFGFKWGPVVKSGPTAVSSGATTKAVTFTNNMPSTSYSVIAILANYTDSPVQRQLTTTIAKTVSGFTVEWDNTTDSANHVLEWIAIGSDS